jgi:ubiquitin thioesterase protein OTUB1
MEPDNYEPFLFHPESGEPMTAQAFCENFVEAVGKEAGQCQRSSWCRRYLSGLAD